MKINQKQIICWSIVMLLSSVAPVLKAESLQDQVLRLEATIRTLTVQNAELIKENDNLRKQMAQAISAKRSGKAVVAGCDVSEMHKEVAFASGRGQKVQVSESWLKTKGQNCTTDQLLEIKNNLNDWLNSVGPLSQGSKGIIDYILSTR